MEIVGIFVFIIILLLLVGIAYLATLDVRQRGFSEIQIFLIRVALVIFFPISLIVYLIFRPSPKT